MWITQLCRIPKGSLKLLYVYAQTAAAKCNDAIGIQTSKPCSHGAVVMESRFKISWENVDCKTGERQRFYFPWQPK